MTYYEQMKSQMSDGLEELKEFMSFELTEELADNLDGKCFYVSNNPDMVAAVRFEKTENGILTVKAVTDGKSIADVTEHEDKYGSGEESEFFIAIYADMVERGDPLLKEITNKDFKSVEKLVKQYIKVIEVNNLAFEEAQKTLLDELFNKEAKKPQKKAKK